MIDSWHGRSPLPLPPEASSMEGRCLGSFQGRGILVSVTAQSRRNDRRAGTRVWKKKELNQWRSKS